ncbi:MAG: TolC family protein [Myxococcales bacterium]|nr:TolC family protein [Myxococcales bacterium]
MGHRDQNSFLMWASVVVLTAARIGFAGAQPPAGGTVDNTIEVDPDPRTLIVWTAQNHPLLRATGARVVAARQQSVVETAPYDWLLWSDVQYSRILRTPTRITDPDDYQRADGAVGVSRLWNFGLQTSVVVGLTYEHFGLAENSALANLPIRVFNSSENYSPSLALQLEQPLLRGRSPEANEAAQVSADHAAEAARLRAEQAASTVLSETLLAFVDVAAAAEVFQLQKEALAAAEEQLEKTRLLAARGLLASVETFPLEQAVVARKRQIVETAGVLDSAWLRLEHAVGAKVARNKGNPPTFSFMETLGLGEVPIAEYDETVSKTKAYGPRIAASEWRRHQALVVNAEDRELPNLVIRASASLDGSDNDLAGAIEDVFTAANPQFAVGIRLDLPLYNRAAQAVHTQARLESSARETEIEIEQKRALYELRRLRTVIENAELAEDLLQETEKWAEQTWLAEKSRLEAGRGTAMLVSQALVQWVDSRLLRVQSNADRGRSLVTYRHAAGSLLLDLGIETTVAVP